MLADPYWPKKVKAHHEEDIAPCVGCNECLLAGFSGKHYYCAVNPLCYAEKLMLYHFQMVKNVMY